MGWRVNYNLKPCPFCKAGVGFRWSRIQCENGHRFYPNRIAWTKGEMTLRWNATNGIHDFCGDIHGFCDYREFCNTWARTAMMYSDSDSDAIRFGPLPCPFCGAEVKMSVVDGETRLAHPDTECLGRVIANYSRPIPTENGIATYIRRWNTRSDK